MDTTALQVFAEVVRRGSFAAVARDRDLDPSAVSRTIGGLEAELGARLFQRTTRRLSLTEAGKLFFERIDGLLEDLEEARATVADVSAGPLGTLRVTTSVSFGQRCIVPLLPGFMAARPGVSIDLILADAVIDIVAERVDAAIRLGRLADSSLIATRLLKTRYYVCASPDYLKRHGPIRKPRDIAAHDCLLFPLPGFRSRWVFRDQKGDTSTVSVKGRVVISNAEALGHCAVDGMGLALLPHWIVGEDLKRGSLVNVFPDFEVTATDFDTAVWFLHPTRAYVPLKVRSFRDFVARALRKV